MLQRCRWPTAAVERSRQARYPVLDDGDIFEATRMILETMLHEAVYVYDTDEYVTAVHGFCEDALQLHPFMLHDLIVWTPEEEMTFQAAAPRNKERPSIVVPQVVHPLEPAEGSRSLVAWNTDQIDSHMAIKTSTSRTLRNMVAIL